MTKRFREGAIAQVQLIWILQFNAMVVAAELINISELCHEFLNKMKMEKYVTYHNMLSIMDSPYFIKISLKTTVFITIMATVIQFSYIN